jgi:hypothetical protein
MVTKVKKTLVKSKSDSAESLFTILNSLIYYPNYYPKGVFGSRKQKTPQEEGF